MSDKNPKLFVLDTNVILHDAHCIEKFEDNDLIIPITVLEELDKFKRGNEDKHFQARHFLRTLDSLTGPLLSESGAPRGENLGNIRVVIGRKTDARIREAFMNDLADHRILNTAVCIMSEQPDRQVVLVSKDINLRMKAKSLGIVAEDYEADKVRNFDELYTGKRIVEGVASEDIEEFYGDSGRVDADLIKCVDEPVANENYVFRNGSKSALVTYQKDENQFRRIQKITAFGIQAEERRTDFCHESFAERPNQAGHFGG